MYIPAFPKVNNVLISRLQHFGAKFVNTKKYGNEVDCACFLIDFAAFDAQDIADWTIFIKQQKPDELDIWCVSAEWGVCKKVVKDSSTHFVRMWWD